MGSVKHYRHAVLQPTAVKSVLLACFSAGSQDIFVIALSQASVYAEKLATTFWVNVARGCSLQLHDTLVQARSYG
jgi:hypothetical protein